ncbi:MAG: DMT family transporter [Chloroflexota bacterium]
MTIRTNDTLVTLKGSWRSFLQSSLIGYGAVFLAAACWGTSGIFVKFIADSSGVSALALAFWRDISTFSVLLAGGLLFSRDRLSVPRADLPWLAAMGVSLGIFHVFWNLGVMLNGAAVTTVQQAAMPAIVAVAAWFIWQEALTWRKILAILLTFIGTVLVSGLGESGAANLTLSGLLVGFGVPLTYAGWSLFGKKMRADYDAALVLTYAFGVGALVLLPFQYFTVQPFPVPAMTYLWFAGLIGLSTVTAFVAYTFSLGRLPASVASILAMSEIAFVTVYAYVLLGEWLTVIQVLGAGLVIAGVLILFQWGRKQNR